MRIPLDNPDKVGSEPERLRELNRQMLKLSTAQRRRLWKYYLGQVSSSRKENPLADRVERYRAFSEDARREAETGPLEARDDFLFLAKICKGLANEFETSLGKKPNGREARQVSAPETSQRNRLVPRPRDQR